MTGSPVCETPSTAATAADELTLRIIGTEHDGRILRIQSSKCTIGSSPGCTLRLRSPGVREVHCLILRGPGGLAVRTWTADTQLNGRSFRDAPLAPGDRLTIGPIELEVLPAGELPAAAQLPATTGNQGQLQLQRLERQTRELHQQRQNLASQLEEREASLTRLQEQLAAAEGLVAELQASAIREEGTPTAADPALLGEFEQLKQQAEELSQQFVGARNSFAKEREAWQTERSQLEFQSAELDRRLGALTATLTHARDEATQERDHWETERTSLNTELDRLRHSHHEHVEMERESREAKVAVTHWREQYEEQVRLLAACEHELAELRAAGTNFDEDPLKLRAELEAGARELDAETERLLEAEEAFEKQRTAWLVECDRLAEAQDKRRLELEAQLQQITEQRLALDQQSASSAPAPAVNEAEQARLAAWQQELQTQADQLSIMQQETLALREAQQTLFAEREQFNAEREAFTLQQLELEQQRADWQHTQAIPSDSAESDQTLLNAQREELTAWQQDLTQREERIASEEARWSEQSTAESLGQDTLQTEVLSLREQLQQERDELSRQSETIEAERAAWEEERARWADERLELCERATTPCLPSDAVEPTSGATDAGEYPEQAVAPHEPYNPESAADVIARLSASGLWKEEEETLPESPAQPEPAWKALVTEEPKAPAPIVHAGEDDDSIESYMQRLLMRVSGDSESTRSTKKPAAAPVIEEKDTTEPAPSTHAEHHEPFDFQKFVPRSTAPELKGLAAMRDLANSTARIAIDVSAKRMRRRRAQGKSFLATLSLATLLGSLLIAIVYHVWLAYVGAAASLVGLVIWGAQAMLLWRQVRQEEREEDEAEVKQAGVQTPVVAMATVPPTVCEEAVAVVAPIEEANNKEADTEQAG